MGFGCIHHNMGLIKHVYLLILALWAAGPILALSPSAMLEEQRHTFPRAPGPPQAAERHNALERINMAAMHAVMDPGIRVRVNSTRQTRSGEWFEVSWSGIEEPDWGDWVALLPAGANPIWSATPLKYDIAAKSKSHMRRGSGKLVFRLISYRQDVVFAFMRGGLLDPRLVALSEVIRLVHPNEPLQGRLALTAGGPSEMLVQWSTHNSSRPVVRYGERRGKLSREVPATSHTYTREEMCGAPASTIGWNDPGLIHVAKLTGLVPGRRYYYRFGDPDWGFSREFSFRAAPKEGPEATVKFLVVADLGQAEEDGSLEEEYYRASLNTTRLMSGEKGYQLLLHNGDISYARGYVSQWDNFHNQMETVTTKMPYMVAPGNHERNWPGTGDRFDGRGLVYDSGGECGVAYERRMAMPIPGPDKQWYAFSLGPVRFIQYSSEHDLRPGSEQHGFISSELAAANRSVTPWLIVSGHRPLYISSTNDWWPNGDQPAAEEARQALEQLLYDNQVDLTLHGHHHSYQRSCPVFKGSCLGLSEEDGSPLAPVHLVTGNAGASLSYNVPLVPSPIWQSIKFWWGYLRVEASATRLTAEVVSDQDGQLLDSFTLKKLEAWGQRVMEERLGRARATGSASGSNSGSNSPASR